MRLELSLPKPVTMYTIVGFVSRKKSKLLNMCWLAPESRMTEFLPELALLT
jgi:hypothetical protein